MKASIFALVAMISLRSSRSWLRTTARPNGRFLFTPTPVRMAPEGPEVSCLVEFLDDHVGGDKYDLQAVEFISGRYANHSLQSTRKTKDGFAELARQLPLPIKSVSCKGKFIWFDLGRGVSIWSTLGLTGAWHLSSTLDFGAADTIDAPRHARAALHLASRGGQKHLASLVYCDMRNFGTLKACHSDEELADKLDSLGGDWLSRDRPTFEAFLAAARRAKGSTFVAKWLMEQKRFCGVGNYILSEALYRARLYPFATFADLSDAQLRRLYRAVLFVVHHSYASQDLRVVARGMRVAAAPVEAGAALDLLDLLERESDLKALFADYVREKGGFQFAVYAQRQCPVGWAVRREEGPHKRTLHWVAELQTEGALGRGETIH